MSFLRKLYYNLSPNMRLLARKITYLPVDTLHTLTSKRQKYEPKKGDIYIGSGNFITQGNHQLNLLKTHLNLKPEDSVLDVGCGIGRTAVALTSYINNFGAYEGFDVVEKGVVWCNNTIKKDFKNFNFTYAALNNDLYNDSKGKAKDFVFPFKTNSFNKVFLFSVFTHMSIAEIANYLHEIKRVLKPGGLCLATFFIYNSKNEATIATQKKFAFPVKKNNYRLMSNLVKSANIAINTEYLDQLITNAGLTKVSTELGYWTSKVNNTASNDFQDIVILKY